jgi:CubicO group peptidase (beta-lactamase class C family)
MGNAFASAILRESARRFCNDGAPGCVFYVTRNGEPFADGSFGLARLPSAPDGALEMSPRTLVHTGSCGKFVTAVAVLRLIQEWNQTWAWILTHSAVGLNGQRVLIGAHVAVEDAHFVHAVMRHGSTIDLDTKVFPLIETYLDQHLIAYYRQHWPYQLYPPVHVRDVTIGHLLTHTSGIGGEGRFVWFVEEDLGGLSMTDVWDPDEPTDGSPTKYDLKKIVTAILRHVAFPPGEYAYSGEGYTILGALIEATTGQLFTTWVRHRLFPGPRFDDIDRRPSDLTREARYYETAGTAGLFDDGIRNADYTHYSAQGGWYWSAAAFCDWLDIVMQKKPVNGGRPILDDPQQLVGGYLGFHLGLDGDSVVGRVRGPWKNGVGGPGGRANTCFVYLRGLGDERICGFVGVNASIDAASLLQTGLEAIHVFLDARPGPIPAPGGPIADTGLLQAVYWEDDAGTLQSAALVAPVRVVGWPVDGVTVPRTDLIGGLAGDRHRNDVGVVELRGMLTVPEPGRYLFRLSSDDGSALWFDDELIVDNDGQHPVQSVESQEVSLSVGRQPIRVQWYNSCGDGALCLEWKRPTAAGYEAIPADSFSPAG